MIVFSCLILFEVSVDAHDFLSDCGIRFAFCKVDYLIFLLLSQDVPPFARFPFALTEDTGIFTAAVCIRIDPI